MNKTRQFKLLNLIMFLALIGILVSGYLTYTHYTSPPDTGICNVGEHSSCNTVNTSKYSEIFGTPVGVLGIIWFLVLAGLCSKMKQRKVIIRELFSWTVIGMVFVAYFIFAETQLFTICFYCTIVHLLVLASFLITLGLFLKRNI